MVEDPGHRGRDAVRSLLLIDPASRVALVDVDSWARYRFDDTPTADRPSAPAPPVQSAVWSAAGEWTAWSVAAPELDGFHEIRLHEEGAPVNRVLADSVSAFYLCPSPCGRYLAHLSPGPLGLELAVSEVGTGHLRVIERGQPLFWSWAADSSRLAVHVGRQVSVIPLHGGDPTVLCDDADSFVAPWWTPDGSVVFAVDGCIVSAAPDRERVELASDPGAGRFVLDPDGRRLARVDVVDGDIALVVTDLLTGDRDVVTRERTAAFAWSPEGRRLAALVLGGAGRLQWLVWDGEGARRLPPFRPGPAWLREVLPFFEQYAQSHCVWSADEAELVAPGVDADGSTVAVVQRVDGSDRTEHVPGARLAWFAPG